MRPATGKVTPQFAVWRVRVVAYGLLLGFVVLAGRGIYLQIVQHEDLTKRGDARTTRDLVLPAHRGRLLDREGAVLASSVPARGVFAFPDQVELTAAQRDGLAKALNLKVVAEGVETPEQQAQLAALECDLLQGYLFSKPIPASDFAGRLQSLSSSS